MSAVDVLAVECCAAPNVNHMQRGAITNAVCIKCGAHWYGFGDQVRKFSRKEWDEHLETTEPDDGEPVPALSMIEGFAAYLRDCDDGTSYRSMRSLGAAVAELERRIADVLEGLEGMKLEGAMPVRVAKLTAALARCKGESP